MDRRTLLAAGALAAAACAPKRQNRFDFGKAEKTYLLEGKVIRLREDNRIAVIEHKKIDGWMEAMIMEFPVPSAEEFARLKPGALVRATVNTNATFYWLTGVTVE